MVLANTKCGEMEDKTAKTISNKRINKCFIILSVNSI